MFTHVNGYEDDAHASKLLRAVGNGERVSREYEDDQGNDDADERFVIRGSTWLKVARMAMDSLEDLQGEERRWVRSAGFEEAWINIPDWNGEMDRGMEEAKL